MRTRSMRHFPFGSALIYMERCCLVMRKKWYKLLSIVIDAYICGGYFCSILNVAVTSRARVWIEISYQRTTCARRRVTSRARVWIEIVKCVNSSNAISVTSRARVWIEITDVTGMTLTKKVTSRARVRIEMLDFVEGKLFEASHFSCEGVD